jgi:CheY-like chemotaxis protein
VEHQPPGAAQLRAGDRDLRHRHRHRHPEDKQKLIFEAFQQADGTTSRKYGGTGLGLSISREIARLLGGELKVTSKPGEGSTFTLFVPLEGVAVTAPTGSSPASYENSGASVPSAIPTTLEVTDDRDSLGGEPFVLIVEDDVTFASILLDLARGAGLKGVISTAGSGTLAMARKLQPDAITLDLGLSDINGFVLLDLLKHDPLTAGIPIHVISGADDASSVTGMGAFGVTEKPADPDELTDVFKRIRAKVSKNRRAPNRNVAALTESRQVPELQNAKILIVDDDIRNIYSLTSVLESYGVDVLHAERGRDGIVILEQTENVDAALIDIMMPEMDGYETMQRIRANPAIADVPLISVTAKAMKGDRQKCLDAGASDYIAKPVDIDLLLALLRVWIGRPAQRHDGVDAPQLHRARSGVKDGRRLAEAKDLPGRTSLRLRRGGSRAGAARQGARWSMTTSVTCWRSARCWATWPRSSRRVRAKRRLRLLLKDDEFAVILLDVYMPGIDGTRPPRSSAGASRPSASRSCSCRR